MRPHACSAQRSATCGDIDQDTWKHREGGALVRRERWIIRRRYPAARFCLIGIYSARREETIRRTQWLPTTTHPWMNLDAMVYQGKGALERSTKKRRPPAKIASRLCPHLVRWRKIDGNRTEKLRAARLMKDGEQIRFVVKNYGDSAFNSPGASAPASPPLERRQISPTS